VLCRTPFWFTFIVNQIQPYNLQGAKRVNLILQYCVPEINSCIDACMHLLRSCVCMCATRTSTPRHGVCVCVCGHMHVSHTHGCCVCVPASVTHTYTQGVVCVGANLCRTHRGCGVYVWAHAAHLCHSHTHRQEGRGRSGGVRTLTCHTHMHTVDE